MADTLQQGFGQSARCLICARTARRGATLCAQCKAALRGGRRTSSAKPEHLSHPSVVRTGARRSAERSRSYSRAAQRATRSAAPPPLGGWGTYATIIAFGLAVCLTGYLAIGDNERALQFGRSAPTPVKPVEVPDTTAHLARTKDDAPTLGTSYRDAAVEEHLALFESLAILPGAMADRRAGRGSRGAKNANATASAALARNAGGKRPPASVAPTPVEAIAAAPPAVHEPVDSDRWQDFLSALSRCEREGVIVGLVCKERARLQYCAGWWGADPQCPEAVASLNTR